jgi:hypothetical protein
MHTRRPSGSITHGHFTAAQCDTRSGIANDLWSSAVRFAERRERAFALCLDRDTARLGRSHLRCLSRNEQGLCCSRRCLNKIARAHPCETQWHPLVKSHRWVRSAKFLVILPRLGFVLPNSLCPSPLGFVLPDAIRLLLLIAGIDHRQ